jgi:hypothetical protein
VDPFQVSYLYRSTRLVLGCCLNDTACINSLVSRGSSVSIVPGYGLDDLAIEVRSLAEKGFSSILCVQTGSAAHPVPCTVDTGSLSLEQKRGRGVTLTTHPHLVPRSRMSRSCISSPPKRLRGVWWGSFTFLNSLLTRTSQ